MMQFYSAYLYRRRAKLWLVLAAVLAVIWLVVWLTREEQAKAIISQKSSIASEPALPTHIDKLNDFAKEVPSPNFETAGKDLRSYPDEFTDKRFLLKNKDKWTVEVMNVAEHRLISDYLETRADRSRFAYFRYLDGAGKERYVLTYGIMQTFQEALGATKLVNFNLPNSSRALPESINRYLDIIDNYEFEGAEKDSVNLEKADKPVAPKLPETKKAVVEDEPVETIDEMPKEKPKKVTTSPINNDRVEQQQINDWIDERPREQPTPKAVDTSELATPPTIKPTAEAKPLEVINAPPPAIEEGGE